MKLNFCPLQSLKNAKWPPQSKMAAKRRYNWFRFSNGLNYVQKLTYNSTMGILSALFSNGLLLNSAVILQIILICFQNATQQQSKASDVVFSFTSKGKASQITFPEQDIQNIIVYLRKQWLFPIHQIWEQFHIARYPYGSLDNVR